MRHEADNWLILADCFNAFNITKQAAVLAEAVTRVPKLTPFVANCQYERRTPVSFQMDAGKRCNTDGYSDVQQGTPMDRHSSGCCRNQC